MPSPTPGVADAPTGNRSPPRFKFTSPPPSIFKFAGR